MLRRKRSVSPNSETGERSSPASNSVQTTRRNHGIQLDRNSGNANFTINNYSQSASRPNGHALSACLDSLKFQGMNSREGNISFSHRTCEWLLQNPQYQEWSQAKQGLLWIKGHPGSGKSTLIYFLKSRINKALTSPDPCIVYFFFNARGEHLEHSKIGFLRSVLFQLLRLDQKIYDSTKSADILEYFQERTASHEAENIYEWQEAELKRLIESLLLAMAFEKQLYLFVDALDEAGKDTAREVASFLSDLSRRSREQEMRLHICFSCRHWPILSAESALSLSVEDENAADIETFVTKQFQSAGMRSSQLTELKNELIRKANGIFQWASLVTRQITAQFLDGEGHQGLKRRLEELPNELHELYERLLGTINDGERAQTIRLFQWLCFSARPLKPQELRYILALDCANPPTSMRELENSENFIADNQRLTQTHPLLRRLTHLSRGLAEVSKGSSRVVQVVHQTVDDYLKQNGIDHLRYSSPVVSSHSAHWQISRSCLYYLDICQLDVVSSSSPLSSQKHLKIVGQNALLSYCLQFWLHHVRQVEENGQNQADLASLLSAQLCDGLERYYQQSRRSPREFLKYSGWNLFHLAADQNLLSLLRVLIKSQPTDINQPNAQKREPLALAFQGGHCHAVDLLLGTGQAQVQHDETYDEILQQASSEGNERAVRLLLERHFDKINQKGCVSNAISAASANGHEQIIRLLLNKCANFVDRGLYDRALRAAVSKGQERIILLLLDKSADVNALQGCLDKMLRTALRQGREQTTKLLLANGANKPPQEFFDEALLSAAENCRMQVVQLLVDEGADVNAQGDRYSRYSNALQVASYENNKAIIQLLLDRGADVNAQGGYYGTALQAAAASTNSSSEAAILLLLDRGADVNAQGGYYGTALQAAAASTNSSSEAAILLLLDRGADINAQGSHYGSALQAASARNSEQTVRLLLDKGADVNAQGGEYGNALQAAAVTNKSSEATVRLLRDRGADVNAQGGRYGNALQQAAAASYKSSEAKVRLLLDRGADVNAQGGKYGNALQAASYWSSEATIRLLLDRGADINAQGGCYGNALQAASKNNRGKIVQLLIDHGAWRTSS